MSTPESAPAHYMYSHQRPPRPNMVVWFEGLAIAQQEDGTTTLAGLLSSRQIRLPMSWR
ncbi:MAG: hypothetical protein HGA45_12260 [Chloroflexales bacterium]|nr:hypothetical protein [Chloroflexales bacterium]